MPSDLRRYYQGKVRASALTFEYFKVETSEGNGVFHILYFGDYLPQKWISDQWLDIHKSPIVDIRATKRGVNNSRKLTRYILTQYVSDQDLLVRCSWSYGWVFKGFVHIWRHLIKALGYKEGLKKWNLLLERKWLWFEGLPPPDVKKFPEIFVNTFEEDVSTVPFTERCLDNLWRGARPRIVLNVGDLEEW